MEETRTPGPESSELFPSSADVNADTGSDSGAPIWASLDALDSLTVVSRAQDGDLEAFEWLITTYQGGLYRLCFRMLNNRSDAEDLVQETFISAWRALPNLSVPQAFIPWLYRTATNKSLDMLRAKKRRLPQGNHNTEIEETLTGARTSIKRSTTGDPAQEYESQAQMRALSDLLQTIPPGPRACWLLKEVHEFSYREIAAIVQLSESTVRGRIARAKRFLAEGMEPWR